MLRNLRVKMVFPFVSPLCIWNILGKKPYPQRSFPRPVLALRGKNHRLRPLRAAAFTLDIYGHVTQKMKQESPARMERFIATVNQ